VGVQTQLWAMWCGAPWDACLFMVGIMVVAAAVAVLLLLLLSQARCSAGLTLYREVPMFWMRTRENRVRPHSVFMICTSVLAWLPPFTMDTFCHCCMGCRRKREMWEARRREGRASQRASMSGGVGEGRGGVRSCAAYASVVCVHCYQGGDWQLAGTAH
jgi:hypothetical protein